MGETRVYAEKNTFFMTRERMNEIGGIILDAAITVHKELGPGRSFRISKPDCLEKRT
jgi:hypothetical protein